MDNKQLADLLFPNVKNDIDFYLSKYKARNINENQLVTRFAPSPTGYLHMGHLLTVFYNYIFSKQTNGVFYLRIENTDVKRTLKDGIKSIVSDLADFNIDFDEGIDINLQQYGNYGPYIQTERKEIYLTFAKSLVEKGLAYPCFCTSEDLNAIREKQMANKESQIGYYGDYAHCRNLTMEQIKNNLSANKSFVIRVKATAKIGDRIGFVDEIRGKIEMADLINDVIILKSETMLPPYNFAHVVDDTLMGTTLVLRGNEWLNSVPEHIYLFKLLGYKPPTYAHLAFVQKIDEQTNTKRKISKRKDPEAAVENILAKGYPVQAVWEYLYTLANTNFEDWRRQNPSLNLSDFEMSFNKISLSGPLFDINKFNDVSKNVISKLDADEVYNLTFNWAKKYDNTFSELLSKHKQLVVGFLNIGRDIVKPRKDITHFSEIYEYCKYMFDEVFDNYSKKDYDIIDGFDKNVYKQVFDNYLNNYSDNDDKDDWFEKVKNYCLACGFSPDVKEYKNNPAKYLGHAGTVCSLVRVALTGKQNTPDLYEICKLLGKEKITHRFERFLNNI